MQNFCLFCTYCHNNPDSAESTVGRTLCLFYIDVCGHGRDDRAVRAVLDTNDRIPAIFVYAVIDEVVCVSSGKSLHLGDVGSGLAVEDQILVNALYCAPLKLSGSRVADILEVLRLREQRC